MRPRLAELLDLEPHPEGGWFRRTWTATPTLTPPGCPDERASATAIHYVLGADEESVWHRVRSDELWLWHRGAPLTLWLGGAGDVPAEPAAEIVLGPGLEDGEAPQALVHAGHWQRARPRRARPGAGGDVDEGAVLVSCVVSPGFDVADFTTLDSGDTRPGR